MSIKSLIIHMLRKVLKLLSPEQRTLGISLFLSLLQEVQNNTAVTNEAASSNPDTTDLPYPRELADFEKLYDTATGGWHHPPAMVAIRQFNKELYPAILYDSVEREVGHLYYALTRMLKPTLVLETGVSRGYSTTCVAAALVVVGAGGHIYAVDPARNPHIWPEHLAQSITWIPKRSQESLSEVAGRRYDLLIIDSLHDYATCVWEVINFEPLLRSGGIMLMHDSLCFDGVGAVVGQLMENPRFETITLKTPRNHGVPKSRCPGLTLVRKLRDGEPAIRFDEKFAGWFAGDTLTAPYLDRFADNS